MFLNKMFCDFCKCEDCQNGADWLHHAQTADGSWICDVCYEYDLCTAGPKYSGPCEDHNCEHRPIIVGDWIK
jgi:hypothetical protein